MTDSIVTVADERRNLMFMRSMTEVSPQMRAGLIESATLHYNLAKERAFRRAPLPPDPVVFEMKMIFGHCTLTETRRFENGRLVLGGLATHYDQDGRVVSVSQQDSVSIDWDNGSPLTADDLFRMGGLS